VILIVTPVVAASDSGNGVTARRWARLLTGLGHRVTVARRYPTDGTFTALIALHARKSAASVRAFRADRPHAPVVVAMTGTDLYPDLASTGVDAAVLAMADRVVVLQPDGIGQLPAALRHRARVVVQSAEAAGPVPALADRFEVAQLAHLREVKDPLRLATAVRLLPASSRIMATHVGEAHDDADAEAARAESAANPRYAWLGPVPRGKALRLLARSRLLVLASRHEGGANVVSEALAAGTPMLSSRIPGSIGLLGPDYPGYFEAGDATDLAAKLHAAETDTDGFYRRLREHCAALQPMVDPRRERESWSRLLAELDLGIRV
jgi:putative glycosyltransferase (TIGR04348 family)